MELRLKKAGLGMIVLVGAALFLWALKVVPTTAASPDPGAQQRFAAFERAAAPSAQSQERARRLARLFNDAPFREGASGSAQDRAADRVDPSTARLVLEDGAYELVVMTGDGALCLLATGSPRFAMCQPEEATLRDHDPLMAITEVGVQRTRVDVLLPDGARDIEITGGGTTVEASLRHNIASAVLPGALEQVAWTTADGQRVEHDRTGDPLPAG